VPPDTPSGPGNAAGFPDPSPPSRQRRPAFTREDFDRIKEELAGSCEGVTAYLQAPAEGLWRQGAESDSDDIVIFEVMTEKVDLADWGERRIDLERRFRQEKIVIRYMPIALV
jgi:hypothetical protein